MVQATDRPTSGQTVEIAVARDFGIAYAEFDGCIGRLDGYGVDRGWKMATVQVTNDGPHKGKEVYVGRDAVIRAKVKR